MQGSVMVSPDIPRVELNGSPASAPSGLAEFAKKLLVILYLFVLSKAN
jgi:hypothetical protein